MSLLDWVRSALPWGIALAACLGAVALTWVLIRSLSERWRREAGNLTAELNAALVAAERRWAALADEASRFSPDLAPPYRDFARDLHDLLQATRQRLSAANGQLIETPTPPLTEPVSTSARVTYLLLDEPRALRKRRTGLRVTELELQDITRGLDSGENLLKTLRRLPLETATLARYVHGELDAAFELLEELQAAGLCGESLDRMAHGLCMHAQKMASLPTYLFEAKESHVLRRAQPDSVSQVWQALAQIRPDVRSSRETLLGWQRDLEKLHEDLVVMRRTVANAKDRLLEAHAQLDVSELHEAYRTAEALAEDAERRFGRPTSEDLSDAVEVGAVTEEVDRVVARLAVAEALRLSLNAATAEVPGRLDEGERQLRQLAEAPRYPLDRVPFQAELDKLRLQLAGISHREQARSPAQFESDLAAMQVIDKQIQVLVERITASREERRRLVALLDAHSVDTSGSEPGATPDWLTWARDLEKQASIYGSECWDGTEAIRIPSLRSDAETLDTRRRRWVPARVEDLLSPEVLSRQTREVAALQSEIESLQTRLDQATQWLQRLRETEEAARSQLQTVYAALDRLEIVAADLLPAELAEEDNHWTQVRKHLDAGYGLDLALQSQATGSVWEKAEKITRWIEACTATLYDWHGALDVETRTTVDSLERDLEELRGIARLDEEPPVEQAQSLLNERAVFAARSPERSPTPSMETCARLAARVADQLRILARLDAVAVALDEKVFEPIAEPVDRWHQAQEAADAAFGKLQMLEAQSGRNWPPVSCDSGVVRAEFELAARLQAQLHQSDTRVTRVVATAGQLAEIYARIVTLVAEREAAYQTLRPRLDAVLDRIDDWCRDLTSYGKQHNADPLVTSAIRARLDEIEASLTQLHIEYDQAEDLIPGEEALRVLDALWRQATRDVPVGAGLQVIPQDWIARPH